MRKVRVARGTVASNVPMMPSKEKWDAAYVLKIGDINKKYLSIFYSKNLSCDEFYDLTKEALNKKGAAPQDLKIRFWGIGCLQFLDLPFL